MTLCETRDGSQTNIKKTKEIKKPTIDEFLRSQVQRPAGTVLKICPLWENTYRLNFWGEKIIDPKKGPDNCVVHSVFIQVQATSNGFKVIERHDR